MKWTRGFAKALGYKAISIIVQIIIFGLAAGWSWVPLVLFANAFMVIIYVVYDKVWERRIGKWLRHN